MQTKSTKRKSQQAKFSDAFTLISRRSGVIMHELAAELGVTPQTVSNWRVGNNEPKLAQLCYLADRFDCTTDELLGRVPRGHVSVTGNQNAVNGSSVSVGRCEECARKDALLAAQAETIKNLSAALAAVITQA